jgi:hypothetical protein
MIMPSVTALSVGSRCAAVVKRSSVGVRLRLLYWVCLSNLGPDIAVVGTFSFRACACAGSLRSVLAGLVAVALVSGGQSKTSDGGEPNRHRPQLDNTRSWEWITLPRREPKPPRERLGPVSSVLF